MNPQVVVCACGRRYEYEGFSLGPWWDALRTPGHDPDECSRRIGYQDRLDGAARMVDVALDHLAERRTLGGAELAEIRMVLKTRAYEVLR